MIAVKKILSQGLPKTGQETQHQTGDDGFYQAGWWKGRFVEDNKTRFVAKTLNGDDVVIDRATGLMWAADGNAVGCNNGEMLTWTLAIAYANNLFFGGFGDWRLPNAFELVSIIDYISDSPTINETFFPNTRSDKYWTSTTYPDAPASALYVTFSGGLLYGYDKGTVTRLRCVRGGV